VQEALLGDTLKKTGWFKQDFLQHIVTQHQAGLRDYSAPIWSLLMFEAFLRNNLDA
jgi:asparagine synthase (glutamine-hydrolysing)